MVMAAAKSDYGLSLADLGWETWRLQRIDNGFIDNGFTVSRDGI